MPVRASAWSVPIANALAFGVCFAVGVMNGVLVTFPVDRRVFAFDAELAVELKRRGVA